MANRQAASKVVSRISFMCDSPFRCLGRVDRPVAVMSQPHRPRETIPMRTQMGVRVVIRRMSNLLPLYLNSFRSERCLVAKTLLAHVLQRGVQAFIVLI